MSVGPKQAQETLRTALAMGADRGMDCVRMSRHSCSQQPTS